MGTGRRERSLGVDADFWAGAAHQKDDREALKRKFQMSEQQISSADSERLFMNQRAAARLNFERTGRR